jgi:MFS transporter, LPLT family, lysophospholipid transporter
MSEPKWNGSPDGAGAGPSGDDNLFSSGLAAVLVAQFISALADNALLFAAIAMLRAHVAPGWQTPLLQATFVMAFIVLAPFVGPIADAWPKGRVMLAANVVKFTGAFSMLMGLHPLLAYGLVGAGAAAYSPAKYGILSELVGADRLVRVNGMMEGSTIVAILLGAAIGGKLADVSVTTALAVIAIGYVLAMAANVLIPRLPIAQPMQQHSLCGLVRDFRTALITLLGNRDARFSLLGTSVFWGSGSTLRLLLVAWVPVALGMGDLSVPAGLSGAVAIGIALGAAAAASFVRLDKVDRALPAGVMIGLVIMAFAHVTHLYPAIALLVLVGVCGGFYVVPLNALLQERGHETVGAGHAVAVQNFMENLAMLALLGMYGAMNKSALTVVQSATIFGGVVLAAIMLLAIFRLRNKPFGQDLAT